MGLFGARDTGRGTRYVYLFDKIVEFVKLSPVQDWVIMEMWQISA